MKGNMHKKLTFEDKFARKYYCEHARLNVLRSNKRQSKKRYRQYITRLVIETLEEVGIPYEKGPGEIKFSGLNATDFIEGR